MGFSNKQEELQDIEVRINEKTAELIRVTGKLNEANELAEKIILTQSDADRAQVLLDETNKKLEDKKKEVDIASDEFQKEVKAVQTMRGIKDKLSLLIEQDTKTTDGLRADIAKLTGEKEQLFKDIEKARESNKSEIIELSIACEKKNHELDSAKSSLISLEVKISDSQKLLNSINASILDGENKIKKLDEDIAGKQNEVSVLNEAIKEKNRSVVKLDLMIDEEQARLTQMTIDKEKEFSDRENSIAEREGAVSIKEARNNEIRSELKRTKEELEKFYDRALPNIRL